LGELIASALGFSLPGQAAFPPSAHFPINRRAREDEERKKGSRERREKEEEEERI